MSGHEQARARRRAAARAPARRAAHWPVDLGGRAVDEGTFDARWECPASPWTTSRLVVMWEVRPDEDRWSARRHPVARHVEVMHRDPGLAMWEVGERPADWSWEAMHADPSGLPRELVPVVSAGFAAGHWPHRGALASDGT